MKPAPRPIREQDLEFAVVNAAKYSDRGEKGLRAWAAHFIAAHMRQPHRLSIEVGTNIGGSAILFGQLLELMYGPKAATIPSLWTVDPYGSKPYVGGHGDGPDAQPPIYTDEFYQAMKLNLHGAAYHAHWLMPSVEFFSRMHGLPYWRPGPMLHSVREVGTGRPLELPIGEKLHAAAATFILLDGEHSADSILADVRAAIAWLGPEGCIVVDNIDTDPKTTNRLISAVLSTPLLEQRFDLDVSAKEWAVLTREP